MNEKKPLNEGNVRKDGVNPPPTRERPSKSPPAQRPAKNPQPKKD